MNKFILFYYNQFLLVQNTELFLARNVNKMFLWRFKIDDIVDKQFQDFDLKCMYISNQPASNMWEEGER